MIKKISFFLPDLRGGGAERVLVTLANQFASKANVDLVLCRARGPLLEECSQDVHIVDLNVQDEYRSLIPLGRYLRQSCPDVLLSTLDLSSMVAVLVKKLTGSQSKIIIRLANTVSIQERSWIKKKAEQNLMRLLYSRANGLIAVSRGVAKDFIEYTGISEEHIHVIYNPVITQRLSELSDLPVLHPWFTEHDLPVILAVGRLSQQKNYPLLIQAFAALQKEIPSRLLILGEGSMREEIAGLTKSLGLANRVEMPGFDPNPFAYMKKADCFVLSSDYEGLPNALIQAMACGCPVVSTDCPSGPREILADGLYGHLVPVGNVEAMMEGLKKSLNGDHRKPPQAWMQQFELDFVAEQYWQLIESV